MYRCIWKLNEYVAYNSIYTQPNGIVGAHAFGGAIHMPPSVGMNIPTLLLISVVESFLHISIFGRCLYISYLWLLVSGFFSV